MKERQFRSIDGYFTAEMKLTDTLTAISKLGHPNGLSVYGLQFFSTDTPDGSPKRLTKANKGYKTLDVLEDCEVGTVTVEIDGKAYVFHFGHDGDEETSCYVTSDQMGREESLAAV